MHINNMDGDDGMSPGHVDLTSPEGRNPEPGCPVCGCSPGSRYFRGTQRSWPPNVPRNVLEAMPNYDPDRHTSPRPRVCGKCYKRVNESAKNMKQKVQQVL